MGHNFGHLPTDPWPTTGGIFGMDLAGVSVEVDPVRATMRSPLQPHHSRRMAVVGKFENMFGIGS